MTRAIDRLVICGAEGERPPPDGCWWKLVFAALKPPVSVEEPADDGDGKVWRYRKTPPSVGVSFAATAPAMPTAERPPWLDRDARAEPPPVRLVSPALAYDEAAPMRGASGSRIDRDKALARGVVVHRLLQSLPDIASAARAEAAGGAAARPPPSPPDPTPPDLWHEPAPKRPRRSNAACASSARSSPGAR